tara:strand:+ start:577 stop:867 length:291 start_codon:yes stop_codon:yes gene_type:complete
METQGNFDMATITQMLQSFGISPTQLGPERLATLQRLAANISDPSKVSLEESQQIMNTLGVSVQGAQSQKAKTKRIGRNEPCGCSSGKKYKKCCGK